MNVMDVARVIGLVVPNGAVVTGTIDQAKVLGALADLAQGDPANVDLYDAVATTVQHARSAGAEVLPDSSRMVARDAATTQLRYRSEMADLFTDLAIDVGLRHHRKLVAAA
jgi:hypothetical protein